LDHCRGLAPRSGWSPVPPDGQDNSPGLGFSDARGADFFDAEPRHQLKSLSYPVEMSCFPAMRLNKLF
jgi:hypothetical protein